MARFKAQIAYNGSPYAGFQTQPDQITVQSHFEESLQRILGEDIRITPSGRTDAGVHAFAQWIHFDANTDTALSRLETQDIAYKLNCILKDVVVLSLEKTNDSFHARKQSKEKTYSYLLLLSNHENPFVKNFVWQRRANLNVEIMHEAAQCLIGEHDFSSFCASDSNADNKIRNLLKIEIKEQPNACPFFLLPEEKLVEMKFTGVGFLKQMVRNLVGTLVAIGEGRLEPYYLPVILDAKDRTKAKATAPAYALFMRQNDIRGQ